MKILVLSSLNPKDDIRIYRKQIMSLLKHYSVTYICTSEVPTMRSEGNFHLIEFEKPRTILQRLKNLKSFLKALNFKEFDVVHIHNPELLLITKFFKKKNPDIKIIFDMHEDFEATILDKKWLPAYLRGVISKIYKIILNNVNKKYLNHVIVTTPLKKEKYNYLGSVSIIENYAPILNEDKREQISLDLELLNFLEYNKNNLNLIFTGLVNKDRGIIEILNALIMYPQSSLTILGIFTEELEREIHQFLDENNISKRVYIKKSVPYQEMIEIMKLMDVGLVLYLPIRNHVVTRPNKLFEYMMTELAVIASDFPLYREVVEQECGILVDPTNINEIALAIKTLHENKELTLKYARNGRKLYLENYNWDVEEIKLLQIYSDLGEIE